MKAPISAWLIVTALSSALFAMPARAAECEAKIEVDDALRFTPPHIEISQRCKKFTVSLQHTGRLPKAAMGHNWVLVRQADINGVARTGMSAGEQNDYIDATDKRVLAHTPVIGGGESGSVSFDTKALQTGVAYAFLCTFAGHSPIMQGTVKLVP